MTVRRRPPPPSDGVIRLSRRHVLVAGAATAVLAGCGGGDGGEDQAGSTTGPATTATTTEPVACVLSPELTAGPYHLDGHLARVDITEGRPGVPLDLRIRVLAFPECAPLEGAAVDIWHCDAGGEYSGFEGNSLEATQTGGTNEERFLRGVQLTDADGLATFRTVFPGWYDGRTVHIHLQVMEGGALATTYEGGHIAHVGQAFFDEDLTAELLGTDAYLARTGDRTTNDEDSIFAQAGPGAIMTMTPVGAAEDGYVGELTCIVDPDATPEPAPLF